MTDVQFLLQRLGGASAWASGFKVAMKLLVNHLTPPQLEELSQRERIPVTDDEGRSWFVYWRHGGEGNVIGPDSQRHCFYPKPYDMNGVDLPYPDIILGQVLAIQTGLFRRAINPPVLRRLHNRHEYVIVRGRGDVRTF